MMTLNQIKIRVLFGFMLLALSACSLVPPYVFAPDEFNRDAESYRTERTDREAVTICSSRSADPKIIATLAGNECARFGRTAKFSSRNISECPFSAVVATIYSCQKKQTLPVFGLY